ncbi:helix-turn-helix transcriptional regulator [Enterococcus faecalis]
MNIGNSLKMRRNELGLTQSEVAEKLYVTRQTISNW